MKINSFFFSTHLIISVSENRMSCVNKCPQNCTGAVCFYHPHGVEGIPGFQRSLWMYTWYSLCTLRSDSMGWGLGLGSWAGVVCCYNISWFDGNVGEDLSQTEGIQLGRSLMASGFAVSMIIHSLRGFMGWSMCYVGHWPLCCGGLQKPDSGKR